MVAYELLSPLSKEETFDLIEQAIQTIGKIKNIDRIKSTIKAKCRRNLESNWKLDFSIIECENGCKILVNLKDECFNTKYVMKQRDNVIDKFLSALFSLSPDVDFGATLSQDPPVIVEVKPISELSFEENNYNKKSDAKFYRIKYNNGRIWEGDAIDNKQLHQIANITKEEIAQEKTNKRKAGMSLVLLIGWIVLKALISVLAFPVLLLMILFRVPCPCVYWFHWGNDWWLHDNK